MFKISFVGAKGERYGMLKIRQPYLACGWDVRRPVLLRGKAARSKSAWSQLLSGAVGRELYCSLPCHTDRIKDSFTAEQQRGQKQRTKLKTEILLLRKAREMDWRRLVTADHHVAHCVLCMKTEGRNWCFTRCFLQPGLYFIFSVSYKNR